MKFIKGILFLGVITIVVFCAYKHVSAGNLYIKPDLEMKRTARLLEEADADFRNGKIHISLSPEIALLEFDHSKSKYKQAVEIIEKYGQGSFTPGDVEDFKARMQECDLWIQKSKDSLPEPKK